MNNGFPHLSSAELTDVGRVRKNNEDSILRLPEQGVFCVADGMGGVQGGDVASKATVDALREEFTVSPDAAYAVTATAGARLAERAINRASSWIKARSDERGVTGTGSTVILMVFDRAAPTAAKVLHAGDSRAYRYRADKLQQLSKDHSVAAAAGLPDDKNLPAMFRGVITRAVGLEPAVQLEETPVDVASGDLFLLCSDGLTKMVSDKHLQKLLRKHRDDDLQTAARVLVDEALSAGGKDNVSVVLVRVSGDLAAAPKLDIPPQTRKLEEEWEAETLASPAAGKADEPERETGQTVDSAKFDGEGMTPPELTGGGAKTPATPSSGSGVTPVADADESETPTAAPLECPASSHRAAWLLAVLTVLAAAGAAAIFFFKK